MCFQRCLAKGADVRCLINHDANLLCARTANGSLRLNEDTHGLAVDADLADTSYCRDLMTLVASQTLSGMSFAFVAHDTDWDHTQDEYGNDIPLRTIRSADISDVSFVTFPAYDSTSVGVRGDAYANDDLALDEAASHPMFNSVRGMFPDGVPLEIRSHVPHFRFKPLIINSTARARRQNFVQSIIGG